MTKKPEKPELASVFKRGQQSIEAHDLTLITNKSDPMYDRRILLAVRDEDVLNLAAVGFVQAISVRLRGDEAIVVDGVQRVKRALTINAVVGAHPYTGNVQSVKEAISRLSAADSLAGKRLIELCPRGVKVPFTVHRAADEAEAFKAKVSANEYREADPVREKAQKAQQLDRHGHSEADIAAIFRVHVQTVKRWLEMDLSKEPGPRKARTKKIKPTAKRITDVLDRLEDWNGTEREKWLLSWVLGKQSLEALVKEFPEFGQKA